MNSGAKMRSWKPRPLSDASNGLRMAMKHSYEMPGMLRYFTLFSIPVVPHKAVAEVSNIGNL